MAERLKEPWKRRAAVAGVAAGVALTMLLTGGANEEEDSGQDRRNRKKDPTLIACDQRARKVAGGEVRDNLRAAGIKVRGQVAISACKMDDGDPVKYNSGWASGPVEGYEHCTLTVDPRKERGNTGIDWRVMELNGHDVQRFARKVHQMDSPSGESALRELADKEGNNVNSTLAATAKNCLED